MTDRVHIITEHTAEPNLRKLARALIALAEQQLAQEQAASSQASPTAVLRDTGDAA